ncbi:MAG TPA: acetamidase/formamidase family protein [Burkholderiales bacterium]|nr:acetamidase/formamidase family protein [Burkholderiales bacterium]
MTRRTAGEHDTADALLRAAPQTLSWGWIAADRAPVLRVRPGSRVRVETVTHQGLNTGLDPLAFFGAAGIAPHEVLPEAVEIHRRMRREPGAGPHLVSGPVYVEGAQPGDLLEVRVLEVEVRVPYGVNATGPGWGAAPGLLAEPAQRVIRLDLARGVALFSSGIEVPLAPFMGIVAVAPPPGLARVSTKPPGPWGGNLDFRHLTAGATLYLPVFNEGALVYLGDGHACQGDGEVNGTAIEISLACTVQFIVHRGAGRGVKGPRAEDAAHDYAIGLGEDLDTALEAAVHETVAFLRSRAGLAAAEAYALASLAVDFRVGEAVNNVVMVYGAIPKRLFAERRPYWHGG